MTTMQLVLYGLGLCHGVTIGIWYTLWVSRRKALGQ